MNTITTAAPDAGAWPSHVRTDHAGFRPILRRDLLRLLRRCRTALGLSTGDVLVLDTLLSFLPCQDRRTRTERPIDPGTLLIVYASNRTVCDRANGMDERVLRRHIARLVAAGLLARRDSATRKRFPLKARGQVTAAYGLDLTPLLLASAKLQEMAEAIELEEEQVRCLRAEALTLRGELLDHAEALSGEALAFTQTAKTLLRRTTLGLSGVRAVLARLRAICGELPCPAPQIPDTSATTEMQPIAGGENRVDTESESGGNGRNVRQVESPRKETYQARRKTGDDIGTLWNECREVAALFPEVPSSANRLREVIYLMGSYVGIGERCLADGLAALSWHGLLRALNHIATNSLRIAKPEAYLARMSREFAAANPA
ncbi:helix-turn-helix domain-containing protein (plasmid) [Salipiger sp. H15]|uniref:Helix-turn-helix domain-containing protein n=1 Tax=Alloyangia sp. H15 TaxID=3029062 RepID=A0AAU8ARS8_9RHOB